jgi:hypothetical protein
VHSRELFSDVSYLKHIRGRLRGLRAERGRARYMPVDEGDCEKTSPSGMELSALPFLADFAVCFLRLGTDAAKNTCSLRSFVPLHQSISFGQCALTTLHLRFDPKVPPRVSASRLCSLINRRGINSEEIKTDSLSFAVALCWKII